MTLQQGAHAVFDRHGGHQCIGSVPYSPLSRERQRCAAATWPLAGDFPDVDRFRDRLRGWDLDKLPKLDTKALRSVDKTLTVRVPALMQRFENPYVLE